MYFDTSYIAKLYFPEPESDEVEALMRSAGTIYTSQWTLPEFHSVVHRRFREGRLSMTEVNKLADRFASHIEAQLWNLVPVTDVLLHRTSNWLRSAPRDLFLRAGDAVHLATASQIGEHEVWTSDRHMLAAASYFGLKGRSV